MKRKRTAVATGVVAAVSVAADLTFRHLLHVEYPWHGVPGFDFVYGFVGCAVIVLASKWLGHALVQRPEDYYGDDR